MSDEKQETDQNEQTEFDIWQQKTHQYVYSMIVRLFETMSFDFSQTEIAELIINSLAVNLGTLIGQVSDEHRDTVMDISRTAIDTSCLAIVKQLAYSKYGNIGHG